MIPDDLARELWVALARHMDRPRDLEVAHDAVMAVVAEHLDQLAPPRDCCPSRRGQMHQNCKALTDALAEEARA